MRSQNTKRNMSGQPGEDALACVWEPKPPKKY